MLELTFEKLLILLVVFLLGIIIGLLLRIRDQLNLTLRRAIRATLTFQIDQIKGDFSMPATISIGKTATAKFTELDAQGVAVPPVGAVTFSSSNPAIATVDPTSGVATGVAPGSAVISAVDAGDNLQASDTLTVADVAVSATLVLAAN
jgi:hypothetical protein